MMQSSWWIRRQGQNTLSRLEAGISELRAKCKCVCPTRICDEDFEKDSRRRRVRIGVCGSKDLRVGEIGETAG